MQNNPFKVSWSAKGNTLCLGHWEISYLDLPVVFLERAEIKIWARRISIII